MESRFSCSFWMLRKHDRNLSGHTSSSLSMWPESKYLSGRKTQNEIMYKMQLIWTSVLMFLFSCHAACFWNVSLKCKQDTRVFLKELEKETPSKYAVLSKSQLYWVYCWIWAMYVHYGVCLNIFIFQMNLLFVLLWQSFLFE